jgi:hypothetical protein
MTYDPYEVFGTAIQCVDQHVYALPKTTLPPSDDVRRFIEEVTSRPKKVLLREQLEISLDITNNNLVGAANLAMLATRHMARGADHRSYPDIQVTEEDILNWNNKIAQFEIYDDSGTNDAPGDTYYFWTHFFAALFYAIPNSGGLVAQQLFEHGTDIMKFVRKYIAHKPNITAHFEASMLGRNIGLALSESDLFE